jgi:hypothetical protein
MNRVLFISLALVMLPIALGANKLRELEQEFEVQPRQMILLEVPVADLRIETADTNKVQADLLLRCRWSTDDCQARMARVELVSRSTKRRLVLELEGLSGWHNSKIDIEGTITVPRSSPLDVEMGVGELQIRGVEQDLRVDLGVGEVKAWLPGAKLSAVSLDVGVGEAEILGATERVSGRRSFLVGSEVFWDNGEGENHVDLEVGVGQISLWIE